MMARDQRRWSGLGAVLTGVAALTLALSGCGPQDTEGPHEAPATTPEESSPAQEPSDSGGEGGPDGTGTGTDAAAGFAPLGEFPELSLSPMGSEDVPAPVVEPGELAELAAVLTQAEPYEVVCDATLRAASATPVTCTVSSTSAQATAYPVHGGRAGAKDYALLAKGELDQSQAKAVMDPEVSSHLGATTLFFDDPALIAPEGLPERVQEELEGLGVNDQVDTCEGITGGDSGHVGVRCTGIQESGRAPFEVHLYPTFAEDSSPAVLALVHRPVM